jgi:ABC-type uncharacterized transport system substrate-binding protein
MINRRRVLGLLTASLFGAPPAVESQPARRFRVGMLFPSDAEPQGFQGVFTKAMHDLGYVEGRNVVFERRSAAGLDEFPAAAAELARLKPDVILTSSTPAAKAVKAATNSIPLVFVLVGDPVGAGLVAGLARPGGNATGLSLFYGEQFSGKWIELLKLIGVNLANVAYLVTDTNPYRASFESQMQAAGTLLGMKTVAFKIGSPPDIDAAFASMKGQHIHAVVVGSDALLYANRRRIADLAAKYRLPAVYGARPYVTAGGLLSYGPNYVDQFVRAASYVDKILKSAKPGDLPVEQPTKFELVINVKAAKAIGLTIPQSLLARADEVLE